MLLYSYSTRWEFASRGGVEDTRLEAKDTKKFRGQGQTLSRPRTKDTDESVSPPKKRSSKFFFTKNFFSGEKGLQNFFSGDFYLRKPKKGLCRFSAMFLAFNFSYFLFQFWGCGCKDIQQIQKDIPDKKVLETLSFVFPAKITVL